MGEKMDAVIVISDDDISDEDSANDGDDSEENKQSTESMAESSSSSTEPKKLSKRASMNNRTWCNIRQEKHNSKHKSASSTDQIRTPTIIDESDDLPDLDSNEECIFVQVFEEEINDDSDCMIVDEWDAGSPTKNSNVGKPVNNDCTRSAFTSLNNKRKLENKNYTPGKDLIEGTSSDKIEKSVTSKKLDFTETICEKTESSQKNEGCRKFPVLSSEGRAKLANILKTVNPKSLQKSKSVEQASKEDSASGSPKTQDKWSFTIERHFSDILSGGSPQGKTTSEENSPEKIHSPSYLSPPKLSNGSFQPITSSPMREHPPVLEPEITKPSAFSNYRPSKSPGTSPTPSKRLKLGRCVSATTTVKNNYEIVNMRLGKSLSLESDVPKGRTIRTSSDIVLNSWNSKRSDVRNFFKPIPSSSSVADTPTLSTRTLKDWQNLRPFNVEFPTKAGLEDSLSMKLSKMHIDTIGVCFEEEGPYCLRHAIKFTHDFSLKYIPTVDIVKQLLFKGILENNQVDLMFSSYRTLRLIQQKYPGTLQIDWDTLKLVIDSVNLGLGFVKQDMVVLLRTSLFLQLTVACYGDELYNCDVVDPKGLRQSMAYKSLTFDSASYTGGVKQLTNWIVCCLTYGEFQEVQEISSPFFRERNQDIHPNQTEDVILRQEVRKILPLLQRLLKIAIEINLSCSDCARTCASELIKSFVYLSLGYKKLLLQTMQSSLLQFKLVSLMLENYCDCDAFSYYEFPSSVRDVVENLLQAQPPRMMNTPPTTPQSEEEEGGGDGVGRFVPKVSSVAVEELAMLQYYALKSYLQCSKAKSHVPLRIRVKLPEKEFGSLSPESMKELEKLPSHIEELRGLYLQLAIELTADTEKYLMMMLCLKDTTVKH
ncbi:uncharacterized protein LOC117339132 isoform X2 [Pecten maximus]|uniref:uncharacterized protein LOC117339132 isoform X2 n=1 Tax=Pecten maximus TaxID=6579 RepID=UPI0014588209|nr:uncharacterized protein LOC117339132 isoform X2 [Pecten maximus]